MNLACLQSMSYLCSNMHFGLGDYHRKYDWMTFNYLHDMMILDNMLMSYEKHEIHLNAQMKRHELMIAFFNCKNLCEKLMRLKWKRILYPFKDFKIQMSLFLYWLNMSTIIRISYPEKSSRVQSRSWHVSLIKLDIVALNLKSLISLYPCFSHDNGEIGLNSY